MALNSQYCADVPLSSYSLTHSDRLDPRHFGPKTVWNWCRSVCETMRPRHKVWRQFGNRAEVSQRQFGAIQAPYKIQAMLQLRQMPRAGCFSWPLFLTKP